MISAPHSAPDDVATSPLPMLIDGEFVSGAGVLDITNPATERVFAQVGAAGEAEFDMAIAAARRSFDGGNWAHAPREHRAATVRRMLQILSDRRAEIAATLVIEVGCPVNSMAMAVQVDAGLTHTKAFVDLYLSLPDEEDSGLPPAERVTRAGGVVQSLKRHVPVGVVAAVSAYNFPFFLSIWKVVPSLLAGNSVVLRPSPLAPLTALEIARAAQQAGVPAGVLSVVVESGDAGGVLLTTDPRVDLVAFTGSTAVGRKVMSQAAPTMKRLQLELGGKSAQIYLPDRVKQAADAASAVCLTQAGQGCALATRVLVPIEHKADVLEAMRERVGAIVVGDPAEPQTMMGPVISEAQRARCEKYVALAKAAGAKVVAGGGRPVGLASGYFFEPTVLDVADNSNPAARDEIFGPVVSVLGYRNLEEAVSIANDTEFGLSGQVFGGDLATALSVARRVRAGTVNVNAGVMSAYVSMGGWGSSGLGRERGPEGLRIYQNMQILNYSA